MIESGRICLIRVGIIKLTGLKDTLFYVASKSANFNGRFELNSIPIYSIAKDLHVTFSSDIPHRMFHL